MNFGGDTDFEDHEVVLHVVLFVAWTLGVAVATWLIVRCGMASSESASDNYFAGGRALKWYVSAGSLMLTNLSTEQLVGLNGAIFRDGCLAGIWWEAGAAVAMLVTATVFLPRYMALGLTTTTGWLGERYGLAMRTLVAMIFLLYYAMVLCPLVLYTGALALINIFGWTDMPLWYVTTSIGLLGSAYALVGGLKAVVVSDCLNGLGLIAAGLWVPIAALQTLPNGVHSLFEDPSLLKPLVLESQVYDDDLYVRALGVPSVPWPVTLTGLTLTNMYYWSTNQVIVQRVLAAQSLAHGQKGLLFAALMKVVGFTFLCLPGIIGILMVKHGVLIDGEAFHVGRSDEVYPVLVKAVMPKWSLGLFSAVMLGSVLSTFNSALNSASTMYALEIYKVYINQTACDEDVVKVAVIFGLCLSAVSYVIAPEFHNIDSIFAFLQRMNSLIALPIVTVFFVGIAFARPDVLAAKVGFSVAVLAVVFGLYFSYLHYLHVFFISFLFAATTMALVTYSSRLRHALDLDRVPTGTVVDTKKALVEMFPWRYLRLFVVAIIGLLITLILALQLGSLQLFCGFGIAWAVTILLLMALSVDAGVGRELEWSGAGAPSQSSSHRATAAEAGHGSSRSLGSSTGGTSCRSMAAANSSSRSISSGGSSKSGRTSGRAVPKAVFHTQELPVVTEA